MKKARWILLAVLITVVAAGASAFVAYGQGKEAGITEGLAIRSSFQQQRSAATNGAGSGQAATAAQSGASRGQGQSSASASTSGSASASTSASTQARGAAAGGNFITGQVKSVNGSDIEVTTQTESVKVKLTDQTQIQKTVAGATGDIQPGERVVVQGSRGTDGAVDARAIQLGQLASLFSGAAAPTGQGATP